MTPTKSDARELVERAPFIVGALARARQTASNDDYTKPDTVLRERHVQRIRAMDDAEEFIATLAATIQRLEAESKFLGGKYSQKVEVECSLRADAARREGALAFYADPENWRGPEQVNRDEMFDSPVNLIDHYGDRARAALLAAFPPKAPASGMGEDELQIIMFKSFNLPRQGNRIAAEKSILAAMREVERLTLERLNGNTLPLHNRKDEVMRELKHCSRHPKCSGPTLIVDHASQCPDGKMEDCDNDHCWVPCPYCVTEEQAASQSKG